MRMRMRMRVSVKPIPMNSRDRGIDLPDCLALAPTAKELRLVRPWLAERDGNPLWPAHVQATLADLAVRLRHGV
jgi:hypothetical protein